MITLQQKILTAKAKGDPTTFEEAIQWTWRIMDDSGKRAFLEAGPVKCMPHLGGHVRNTLGMWKRGDEEVAIVAHMRDRFKIQHPADISGMILNALYALNTGQPYDPATHAEKCREHWVNMGINPDKEM